MKFRYWLNNMSEIKKWDLKQVGSGAGLTALTLFAMQGQGIDFVTKNQQAQSQIVIEKTIANSNRIESLEHSIKDINNKIDVGFDDMREQMQKQIERILEISNKTTDRYTKTEHMSYTREVDARFRILEDKIRIECNKADK